MIDEGDAHHDRVERALDQIRWQMVTTEACLTEAMHLLYADAGWPAQAALLRMIVSGELDILPLPATGPPRIYAFMERFRDQPCDYADATLLVAAEDTGIRRVFTIDRHFHAYRLANGEALDVVP
jgi:predicted nucleic acid-binding protein